MHPGVNTKNASQNKDQAHFKVLCNPSNTVIILVVVINSVKQESKPNCALINQLSACSGVRIVSWIIYCWLIWCERKTLFLTGNMLCAALSLCSRDGEHQDRDHITITSTSDESQKPPPPAANSSSRSSSSLDPPTSNRWILAPRLSTSSSLSSKPTQLRAQCRS